MKFNNLLVIFISVLFNQVLTLNILGVFPYQGKSHFFVFAPYLRELVNRGHNLTVISYFPQEKPLKNYHDISLAGKIKILEESFPIARSYWTIIQLGFFLLNEGRDNCITLLEDENVQNLWKSKTKFDVVLVEQFNSDCALGLAHELGAPVVGLTSHVLLPWHYEDYGVEYNPAYVASLFLEGGTKPTLYQRIERSIFHNYFNYLHKFTGRRNNQNTLAQYFDNVPALEELARKVKLMLLYTNHVLSGSGLYPPNIHEVGGYHVAKPKELPKLNSDCALGLAHVLGTPVVGLTSHVLLPWHYEDYGVEYNPAHVSSLFLDLQKFIDESEHGVIYISFGSMLRATSTPKDKLEAIIRAVSQLPQRIVWKWEEKTLPGNPKNIHISNWLPQNDILAHPNVLAFYSHCGMLGTTEAIHHGVPMIGMPIFGDQPGNAGAVEESGLGVLIDFRDLTTELLLEKIKIVLNPEFRRKVKDLSRVWHDRPQSAMDSAIYWTEYAARTGNYSFRTPASTVPLYQYRSWDIIAVLGSILFAFLYSLKVIISLLLKSNTQQNKRKIKTK